MEMLCVCVDEGEGKKFKCGVHEVDVVYVTLVHHEKLQLRYTCEDVEEVGFSNKLYVVATRKVADEGKIKEVKVLEVYV
jgi:hypothetical protein